MGRLTLVKGSAEMLAKIIMPSKFVFEPHTISLPWNRRFNWMTAPLRMLGVPIEKRPEETALMGPVELSDCILLFERPVPLGKKIDCVEIDARLFLRGVIPLRELGGDYVCSVDSIEHQRTAENEIDVQSSTEYK